MEPVAQRQSATLWAGRKAVLANGIPGGIKAFDGGMEKGLQILQKSNDEGVMNTTNTRSTGIPYDSNH
jgi:hypothetical protein